MPKADYERKAIEKRAYAIWEQGGRRHGDDWAHWFQAEAGIELAQSLLGDIRDAIFTSNRAFVFLKKIEYQFIGDNLSRTIVKWKFVPHWENGGITPTKDMANHISFAVFDRPIDLGFEFSDYGDPEVGHTMIGPKAIMHAAHIDVPVDVLEKVRNGEVHAYIWGWADYNDMFPSTDRHRSEFCVELVVHGDARTENCHFVFRQHRQHNGFDNECLRKPRPYIAQGYYKFLDTCDIDKVIVDGTLVVSSFEYFRGLEVTKFGTIADPLEAASELTVREQFVIHENSPELEVVNNSNIGMGLFWKFADVSGGGVVDISGARFIHTVPNAFIYSASVGEISTLTKAMCVDPEKPYSACLKILNLAALRERIFTVGRIRDLNCKVSDVFEPGEIRTVEYEARSRDLREGGVLEPSPFKKGKKHEPQSEVRLLLIPKEQVQIPKNRLIIEFPDPELLFEEVFRNYRSADAAENLGDE